MNNFIFTTLTACALFFAAFVSMINLQLSLYMIAAILAFGIGLFIYRIKFGE